MKDFTPLLNTIARYKEYLPDELAKDAEKLSTAIFDYSHNKFSQSMSEDDKRKLDLLILELFMKQLRENYQVFNYKVDFGSHSSAGWEFDYSNKGNFLLEASSPCVCAFHTFETYEGGEGQYYTCTCVEEYEMPPKECPLKVSLVTMKTKKWVRSHMDEIKEHLADVLPQLIYIAKFPSERNTGFCNQLLKELSRSTFEYYLINDLTFRTLCNQLTPNHF